MIRVMSNLAAALYATPPSATFEEAYDYHAAAEKAEPGFWAKVGICICTNNENEAVTSVACQILISDPRTGLSSPSAVPSSAGSGPNSGNGSRRQWSSRRSESSRTTTKIAARQRRFCANCNANL